MDEYHRNASEALEHERQRQLSRSPRRLVPGRVRERAGTVARRAHERGSSVPGFDQAEDLLEEMAFATDVEIDAFRRLTRRSPDPAR